MLGSPVGWVTSFWNNGTSQSRGVAILIKKCLYIKTENVNKDNDGRLISLTAFLSDDQTYQLTAVYAPNNGKCRKRFFTDLQHLLLQYGNPINIVGGDMNCVMNHELDKKTTLLFPINTTTMKGCWSYRPLSVLSH